MPVGRTDLIPADGVSIDRPIVDVRQLSEWEIDHVSGATQVELGDITVTATRLEDGVQVHCGHGQRAMTAASLLERAGVEAVSVTTGGPSEVTSALAEARPMR